MPVNYINLLRSVIYMFLYVSDIFAAVLVHYLILYLYLFYYLCVSFGGGAAHIIHFTIYLLTYYIYICLHYTYIIISSCCLRFTALPLAIRPNARSLSLQIRTER